MSNIRIQIENYMISRKLYMNKIRNSSEIYKIVTKQSKINSGDEEYNNSAEKFNCKL